MGHQKLYRALKSPSLTFWIYEEIIINPEALTLYLQGDGVIESFKRDRNVSDIDKANALNLPLSLA